MGKVLRISLVEDCLALSGPVNGGVAMVHSRKLKGQTVVSTQSFVVAVKSYGGVDSDQFLTPNLDDVVAIDVNP